MSVYEPDAAVYELLGAAGISGLTKATAKLPPFDGNLCLCSLVEPEDNAPVLAVFVSPLPSGSNVRFCGSTHDYRTEYVLVEVRGQTHDEAGALTLARACRDALHCADASAYGYFSCYVLDPQPKPQALDTGSRNVYAVTVEMRRVT